jgi:hypothetical protein
LKKKHKQQEEKMANPHWQRLIEAQQTGARITIQQKIGDPLVNVQVVSTDDGVLIKSEGGHTRTIDLADICGVETLEIVEKAMSISMTKSVAMTKIDLKELSRIRHKVTAIETKLPCPEDFFRVRKILRISPRHLTVSLIDHQGEKHKIDIGKIVHVYAN